MFLATINAPAIIVIVVGSIVVIIALLVGMFPKLRQKLFPTKEKEDSKKAAKEMVDEIVVEKDTESKLDQEIKRERIIKYLEKKEKDLNIILSEDDIDPLIIQILQDEKDNK